MSSSCIFHPPHPSSLVLSYLRAPSLVLHPTREVNLTYLPLLTFTSPQSHHLQPFPPPSPPSLTMASLFGTAATAAATANNSLGDISKDVPLVSPPEDSISDLAFSPESQHLAVSSWDKKVRIYEVNNQGNSEGKAMFEHEAPVLSVHWSRVHHSSFPPSLHLDTLLSLYPPDMLTQNLSSRTARKS